MTESVAEHRHQLRQPRLAEMVADVLRRRILSGQLADGSMLPKQEELIDEFGVSKPSMREALRILETEGLITVQRGNVGGAIVHAPQVSNAAYMLGLVLQARDVTLHDVGAAIKHIEPVCAALCAERDDRMTTVVPRLTELHEAALNCPVDDELKMTQYARLFHEELVAGCGNETMIQLVGALETLWSAHEQEWAQRVSAQGEFPDGDVRSQSLEKHQEILDLIVAGDADSVARAARTHLEGSIFYAVSGGGAMGINAAALR